MSIISHVLASGSGWRVSDVVCHASPHDRPLEECHDAICIAAVMSGTFQYRSALGSAVLAPGTILLGNAGTCFECGHEHGVGDRCLALHLTPHYVEAIAAAVPGARVEFTVPRLPPFPQLIPIIAAAESAREERDGAELEELAIRLTGAALSALAVGKGAGRAPSARDERRVSRTLRRIEAEPHERLALGELAREAAMSPYHFLRVFRQVVGMTPHQFVLHTRLHRAAVRLRLSDQGISAIAFEAGFNDLSTFNRRFRRLMGASPAAYRARSRPLN